MDLHNDSLIDAGVKVLVGAGVGVLVTIGVISSGAPDKVEDKLANAPASGERAVWICKQPETEIVKAISNTQQSYNAKYQKGENRYDLTWQSNAVLGSPVAVEEPYKSKAYTEPIDQAFLDCVTTHEPIPVVTAPHVHQ